MIQWVNKIVMKNILIYFIILTSSILVNGQVPSPIKQEYHSILIVNAKAHIGNGKVIDKAAIGIIDGKIIQVSNALTFKVQENKWDTIIDATGQELYPGFIAANTTIGLTEIDAVRATNDFRETGYINPNIRSLIAFNIDSKIIYTIRTNGILSCQSVPRGGLISGTSSVFGLDGWNWEDAVYLKDDGVHINWPKKYTKTGWWAEPGQIKENMKYLKTINVLVEFFKESKVYLSKKNTSELNLKKEAMRQVFEGEQRVYFHAEFAPEINDLIDFSRTFKLKHPVLVGGYDANFLVDRLKENKFSIMLTNPHSLPKFDGELPSVNFKLASMLIEKNILFCIQNRGNMDVMNARNLPFLAGTAMSYGLSEEDAITSISLNVAKILGIDNKIGSIEIGKDATLFISKGNALEMMTNNVVFAMIKGQFIELTNHQMQLEKKYLTKYGVE